MFTYMFLYIYILSMRTYVGIHIFFLHIGRQRYVYMPISYMCSIHMLSRLGPRAAPYISVGCSQGKYATLDANSALRHHTGLG